MGFARHRSLCGRWLGFSLSGFRKSERQEIFQATIPAIRLECWRDPKQKNQTNASASFNLNPLSVHRLSLAHRLVEMRSYSSALCDPHLLPKHLQLKKLASQICSKRSNILPSCLFGIRCDLGFAHFSVLNAPLSPLHDLCQGSPVSRYGSSPLSGASWITAASCPPSRLHRVFRFLTSRPPILTIRDVWRMNRSRQCVPY